MTPAEQSPPAVSSRAASRGRDAALLALALAALLVVFHTFAWPLLPDRFLRLDPARMEPLGGAQSAAYAYPFTDGAPDRPHNPHSRVWLFEDGAPLVVKTAIGRQMFPLRGGAWAHVPGYLLFSATDNSDPRTGGRTYTLRYPPASSEALGLLAAGVFIVAMFALYHARRQPPPPSAAAVPSARWRLHVAGMSLVLLAGLYANTGTLAPYANTSMPQADLETGYLYNVDHLEFRALFNFVDGADRSQWEHGLYLRRILHPLLAWPFMHLLGFKTGGILANFLFCLAGLLATTVWLRHRVGEAGARLAGWLLAIYPGAAYWSGLPYLHGLIFPLSLALLIGLSELDSGPPLRRVAWLSLGMGLAYLGYDLIVFFLPASVLVLAFRRQWTALAVSAFTQVLPLATWLFVMRHGFDLPLSNSNSGLYGSVINAYLQPAAYAGWSDVLAVAPSAAWHVWFGSNFLFLPGLALAAFALNPLTSRVRLTPGELALLAVAAALFLFTNLAPEQNLQWNMRGSWISRLYQPLFPVLVFFLARWWQHLPALPRPRRFALHLLVAATLAGNAAVVFGPLLGNPLRLSEEAFYRFYTHTDVILIRPYESNLREHGRRPLGFPRPVPPAPVAVPAP